MGPDQRGDTARLSRPWRIIPYACAIILPFCASLITVNTPALHPIPLALNFTIICALGALAGFGPALAAILVSIPSFELPFSAPLYNNLSIHQLERFLVLIAAAFFITLLSWKQRSSERRLRSTLASLRERTSDLIQAQQASELASWLFNSGTMETLWDEGSTQVFGRPFSDLKRQALPLEFIFPADHQHLTEAVRICIETGQSLRIEFRVVWPDGDVHWLEARGTRIAGSPHLWRGVIFDITRRKSVEAALIHSEKLAAVGRLASTIAHEVNNPLESVTNLLYLIDKDDTLSSTTRSYLELAEQELARLSNITRLTLTFARSASLPVAVDVADTCESVLTIYQHRYEVLGIHVQRHYDPIIEIDIPPDELRQILINLVANAVEAAQGNAGIIRIETSIAGGKAILLVEDNGQGIQPAHQSRIFDAFFTTKADMGTGIGLWVTRELTEKNGGTIAVESGDLDNGMRTRFRLTFPLASPISAEEVAEPAAAVSSPTQNSLAS